MRHILSRFYGVALLKNILINSLNFVWSWRHEIFVFSIFVVALLLRLQTFSNPYYRYNGDYNRDYLIAHHILAYHEFPLVGPQGGLGANRNSPAYFYFLALPLLIKDSIIFLGLLNVFLQMTALLLIYFLGRMMFGKPVGLGALAIFAANENIIYQASVVWQPHIMQPFFLLSIFLLFLSYTHKSYPLLLSSIACFVFSSVLHQSVLVLTPFYLIAVFLTLRANQKQSWRHYAGATVFFFGIFILLYAPLLLYFSKNQVSTPSLSHSASAFFSGNNAGIISRFLSRAELLSSIFLARNNTFFPSVPVVFVIATFILFYLYRVREKEKKIIFFLIFGTIVQFLAITALVASDHFYVRYLTPLFGVFAICIAELVYGLVPRKSWTWIITAPVILMLIFSSSQNIFDRLKSATHSVYADPKDFFYPQYTSPPFITPLIQEIISIKEKEHRKDFTFFDIRVYGNPRFGYWVGTFWVALERDFAAHLVRTDDNNSWNFTPIGFPQYVVFSCGAAQDADSECINSFLREYPDFHITKELPSDPTIYVAQKQKF